MQTKLSQGAEAVITKENNIITKNRFKKAYRHPELDRKLRKHRTRAEAKILNRLKELKFPAPEVIEADEDEGILKISFIDGKLVKDVLDKKKEVAKQIGKNIAVLHNNSIIHGDLTTSNMIFNKNNNKIYFIDFGLSSISKKVEDKAVDLHLLDRALESTHYQSYPEIFNMIITEYKRTAADSEAVLKRLEKVNRRGRNKGKS